MLARKDRVLLIAVQLNHHPLGVLRYDLKAAGTAEVNINLRPEERGKGWGAAVIRRGNRWIAGKFGIRRIRARIKTQNGASKVAFSKAGFLFLKSMPDHDVYEARLHD